MQLLGNNNSLPSRPKTSQRQAAVISTELSAILRTVLVYKFQSDPDQKNKKCQQDDQRKGNYQRTLISCRFLEKLLLAETLVKIDQ